MIIRILAVPNTAADGRAGLTENSRVLAAELEVGQ